MISERGNLKLIENMLAILQQHTRSAIKDMWSVLNKHWFSPSFNDNGQWLVVFLVNLLAIFNKTSYLKYGQLAKGEILVCVSTYPKFIRSFSAGHTDTHIHTRSHIMFELNVAKSIFYTNKPTKIIDRKSVNMFHFLINIYD